jgi:Ca2+-binding EF-hand superfamily protein
MQKPLSILLLALAFPAAVAAQTAPAPSGAERSAEFFHKIDTSNDGKLSKEEWLAAGRRERGFQRIDTDKSGAITPDELKAAAERLRARQQEKQPG